MNKKILLLISLGICALILAVIAAWPAISGKIYSNLALVKLLRTSACDPDWFVCRVLPSPYPLLQYDGNAGALRQAQVLLEKSLSLTPTSDAIRLRLAEIVFARGDRQSAANYLDQLTKKVSRFSPLLKEDRYEARLVAARQQAEAGDWEAAINNFRLGLAWGDERTLPVDERDYFLALVEWEKSQAHPAAPDALASYRIGRYLAKAGDWQQAYDWLRKPGVIAALPSPQAAWALLTIGRYQEANGDWRGAIRTYRMAIQQDPGLRQAYIRLLPLMYIASSGGDIASVENRLLSLGPTYHLGAQGEDYQAYEPAALPDGWRLVGYDLDEEMLEQGKSQEIYLWWQGEGKRPQGEGWLRVGDYWVQRQVVTNLFPNAGFEWGVDERGIPLGHDREIYTAPAGSLYLDQDNRQDVSTSVLVNNNSPSVNHVALASKWIPVDSERFYLMSGWIWDEWGAATLGRSCKGKEFLGTSPFYLTDYKSEQPLSNWLYHAQFSSPHPGYIPDQCEILVMNDSNSEHPARFDNLLFAGINPPE